MLLLLCFVFVCCYRCLCVGVDGGLVVVRVVCVLMSLFMIFVDVVVFGVRVVVCVLMPLVMLLFVLFVCVCLLFVFLLMIVLLSFLCVCCWW